MVGMTVGVIPGLLGPPILEMVFRNGFSGIPSAQWQQMLSDGAIYSSCVMAILLAHEMGHFLQAKRYGVPASPPFFIPFPISPFGTMGAVIVQGAGKADRKMMFDIAVSGPLAGLVLAIPITYWGIVYSQIIDIPQQPLMPGSQYGDPLMIKWMAAAILGEYGPNQDIQLNPMLFAGWVGIFVTALNLIPVGQLDGGHILYTLIGKRAHVVAITLMFAAIGYMVWNQNFTYMLILFLLIFFGPRHPPTANDDVPLGWPRIIIGWLTLAFIILGFTPDPIPMPEMEEKAKEPEIEILAEGAVSPRVITADNVAEDM